MRVSLAGFTTDAAGFDAFYSQTGQELLGQLYAMCGDREEALDCLQEAYAKAWQQWDRVAQYDEPARWIRTVAWRIAVGRWRRAQRATRALRRHGAQPSETGLLTEDYEALRSALKRLPTIQRQAIVMYHIGGLSVEELAEQLGVPTGTVKARLARGRDALAKLLAREGVNER
jgi:RNA polymerase sigma-70 factor, ECF subfamily